MKVILWIFAVLLISQSLPHKVFAQDEGNAPSYEDDSSAAAVPTQAPEPMDEQPQYPASDDNMDDEGDL